MRIPIIDSIPHPAGRDDWPDHRAGGPATALDRRLLAHPYLPLGLPHLHARHPRFSLSLSLFPPLPFFLTPMVPADDIADAVEAQIRCSVATGQEWYLSPCFQPALRH